MWNDTLGAGLRRWCAVIALCAGAGFFAAHRRPTALATVLATLPPDHRVTEARLFGMTHAELLIRRGAQPSGAVHRGAAGELLKDSNVTRDPHAYGVALLIAGNTDAAVMTLDRAARTTTSVALLTDLAAARYEQGRRNDSPESFASALAASHRALRLDRHCAAALFNRALALDALQLTPLAKRAFNDYLHVDPDSSWAIEARRRLDAMPQMTIATRWWSQVRYDLQQACKAGQTAEAMAAVKAFPEEARRWGEGPYLTDWAEAVLARRDAGEPLTLARCVGDALRRTSGESLLSDAVASIDGARDSTEVADALRTYRQGRIAYSKHSYGEGLQLLEKAAQRLADAGSPMQLIASYYVSNLLVDTGRAADALPLIDEIDGRSKRNYIALHARLQWARSLAFGHLGRVYEVLETAKDSAETFETIGELESAARMRTTISSALTVLGRDSEAWANRRETLRRAGASGSGILLDAALANTVRDELRQSHFDVAWAFASEASGVATSDIARTEALLWKTFAFAQMVPSENVDFAPVHAAAEAIRDDIARRGVLDNISLAEAKLILNRQPARALSLLDAVVDYRAQAFPYTLPEAWVARAQVLRALGRNGDATAELDKAIALLDKQRQTFADPLMRDGYSGNDVSLSDVAEQIATEDGDYPRVFAVSERSRAALLDPARVVLDVHTVAAALPPGCAFIHITSTSKATVIAFITQRSTRFVVIRATREHLGLLAAALTAAIVHDDVAWKNPSAALYDALLAPIRQELTSAGMLIISPDQNLPAIPYATLLDPLTNRLLVQDHPIAVTPSASAWSAGHQAAGLRRQTALLVGDPEIDSHRFPELPKLPAAREEIRALAPLYPSTVQLAGAEATIAATLRAMEYADVIHIAAHAVPNDRDAASSVIVLSPLRPDTGLLYAGNIARLRLRRAPVVFLAGCSTAVTPPAGHGSIRNIAAAFLIAGSSSVIGTLWDVTDTGAKKISYSFHRALSQGDSPSDALRNLQLSMIAANSPPRQWAAFQTYSTR